MEYSDINTHTLKTFTYERTEYKPDFGIDNPRIFSVVVVESLRVAIIKYFWIVVNVNMATTMFTLGVYSLETQELEVIYRGNVGFFCIDVRLYFYELNTFNGLIEYDLLSHTKVGRVDLKRSVKYIHDCCHNSSTQLTAMAVSHDSGHELILYDSNFNVLQETPLFSPIETLILLDNYALIVIDEPPTRNEPRHRKYVVPYSIQSNRVYDHILWTDFSFDHCRVGDTCILNLDEVYLLNFEGIIQASYRALADRVHDLKFEGDERACVFGIHDGAMICRRCIGDDSSIWTINSSGGEITQISLDPNSISMFGFVDVVKPSVVLL
jgi:hypothetical protein